MSPDQGKLNLDDAAAVDKVIARIRSGDTSAFTELWEPLELMLVPFLVRLVANKEDASDLAQNTGLKLYRFICETEVRIQDIRKWCFRTTRNTAIDFLRRKRRRCEVQVPEDFEPSSPPTRKDSRIDRIQESIERLPEREQQILILYFFHGCTFEEIGSKLQLSAERVRQIYHQVIRQLKDEFSTSGTR